MLRNTINTFITATLIMLLGVSSTAQAIVPMGDLMGSTSVTFSGQPDEPVGDSSTLTIALDPAKPAIEEQSRELTSDDKVTVTYTITSTANGPDDYTLATVYDGGAPENSSVGGLLTTDILEVGGGTIASVRLGATAAISIDGRTITVLCDAASSDDTKCNGITAGATVFIGGTEYTVAEGGVSNTEVPSTITLDDGVELPSIVLGTPIAERKTFKVVVSGDALLDPAEDVTFTLDITAQSAENADLIGKETLTYTIAGAPIKPSVERYARNLSPDKNPVEGDVADDAKTEYDSGGGSQWFFKTGVSAKQDDEVEFLIVLNAGNQGPQTNILLKETLSPFVEYLPLSALLNRNPLVTLVYEEAAHVRMLSWNGDVTTNSDLPLLKNTSAHLTYKVKVTGGVGGDVTPQDEPNDDKQPDAEAETFDYGTPWPVVVAHARKLGLSSWTEIGHTVCWDKSIGTADGSRNGWVVGENTANADEQAFLANWASQPHLPAIYPGVDDYGVAALSKAECVSD